MAIEPHPTAFGVTMRMSDGAIVGPVSLVRLPTPYLESLIAAAETVFRDRHPDVTGFAPPRFEGDENPQQKGE